jgi:hypothetical protein
MLFMLLIGLQCLVMTVGVAQQITTGTASVTKADGGPMTIDLGNRKVNEGSKLARQWVTIHDKIFPVDIVNTAGITLTPYVRDFRYAAKYEVEVTEPIVAIQVCFVLFNVWGEKIQSLSHMAIVDLPRGRHELNADWVVENDTPTEYFASICYVARVRTQAGKILYFNPEPVIAEAKQFTPQFSLADLTPDDKKKR